VWTPKRIVLLVGWIVVFVGAYMGSSYVLGGIDGLPPLPDRYKPIAADGGTFSPTQPQELSANKKLRLAFGEGSEEVKSRKFKLEIEPRGLVLAAKEVTIEPDGRAKLVPFSVAIFSKDKGEKKDNAYPEITTVQADVAYLKFDKPLKSLMAIESRKIIGGELTGDIKIINNRGTKGHTDDVSLVSQGTLYYDDALHQVWTKEPVRILDLRSKPQPTTIDGVGADLYLAAEPAKDATPATKGKNKNQSAGGVERVELRSDVVMHLWVDSKSGLMGPPRDDAKVAKNDAKTPPPANGAVAKKPDAQEENAHVIIDTQGPFTYDFKTDKAVFEIAKRGGPRPNLVTVDRTNEKAKTSDQLKCDLLEIQFARKGAAAASNAATSADKLEIETVRATGKNVVLTSDAEVLWAEGNEFTYNNKTLVSVLKGQPSMHALKEGNEIWAPELLMVNVKGAQQATANGEGTMYFYGTTGATRPQEAKWKKKLTYGKQGDRNLLTLYGDAVFRDPEHQQELKAETLEVLLSQADKGPNPNEASEKTQKKPAPTEVRANGGVTAMSPDLIVEEADNLILVFRDVVPGTLPPPNSAAPGRFAAPGKPAEAPVSGKPAEAGAKGKPVETVAKGKPAEPAAPRPIKLKAHKVQAQILRELARNELQEVWCEGNVSVLQAPEKAGESGVDIRGNTLNLLHRSDGDILTVTGNQQKSAQVQMDQLFILGPVIEMDQTRNDVKVNGLGVMRMLSKQSFDGKELAKPSELRVEWEGNMYFDGTQASFYRSVYATQDTGRMSCEELQVTLDRHVSLKEGPKGDQPAAVEKLVCHKKVGLEDTKREGGKIVEFTRLSAPEVVVDNDNITKERSVNASGPQGMLRIFKLGSKDNTFGTPSNPDANKQASSKAPTKGAKPAEEKEFKLTLIGYDGKMYANNNLGIAKFWDRVKLIQVPTENPDLKIDINVLPSGYMLLHCGRLEMWEHKLANGTTTQEMRANDKVYVEGQIYSADCDVLKYDSAKEQIILEAILPGTYAHLFKEKFRGAVRDTVEAKKIYYNRITGDIRTDGSRSISIGSP
jgi:hypothetical protein